MYKTVDMELAFPSRSFRTSLAKMIAASKSNTCWANAKVKLHSQVHFRSNKILSPKQAEDEVVPSSSLVEVEVGFKVGV